MATFNICNQHSGLDLGDWEADTEQGALDALAQAAGYKDYADECAQIGIETTKGGRAELIVTRLGT